MLTYADVCMQPALSLKFKVIGGPQLRTHLSRQTKKRVTFKHNLYLCICIYVAHMLGVNVLNVLNLIMI